MSSFYANEAAFDATAHGNVTDDSCRVSEGRERRSQLSRGLLLRADCLMLCGAFLRLLLRNVMSHDAATDRSNDCVVAGVVSGYTADDCPFRQPAALAVPAAASPKAAAATNVLTR